MRIVRNFRPDARTQIKCVFVGKGETSSLSITSKRLLDGEWYACIGLVGQNLSQDGLRDLAVFAERMIGNPGIVATVQKVVNKINATPKEPVRDALHPEGL